jgi:hypothetical protein
VHVIFQSRSQGSLPISDVNGRLHPGGKKVRPCFRVKKTLAMLHDVVTIICLGGLILYAAHDSRFEK